MINEIHASVFNSPAILVLALGFLVSCGSDPTPKPRGYFKIDLPEKEYRTYQDSLCPFSFEYPVYARIEKDTTFFDQRPKSPCWMDIVYPDLAGRIHISYKELQKGERLSKVIDDAHRLTFKHTVKAESINETKVRNDFGATGLIYEVGGDAATSTQFYITDSTHHFLRGSLYFYTEPNEDSLAPVINFVKKDIFHMVRTLRWKNSETE